MKYTSLQQIKDLYKSVFYMEEDMIIDAIMAITIATKLPGDPIWLLIIGGSSSGKSELINILNKVPFVHAVSSMTENTFLSNMKLANGKEASLLHRIGVNGMITMKDYTSILSMRSEKRELIISQMREIFDGKLDKESGNGHPQHWEGKINWIGACTDSIYIAEGESAGMGRRTINYVMPEQDRIATTRRALKNTGDIAEKRIILQDAVAEFVTNKLAELPSKLPDLPDDIQEVIIKLANFITLARTPTERDFRGTLKLVPNAEMPMRVFSMFQKIAQMMVHISDEKVFTDEHFKILCKIAFDSIPKQRMIILKILAEYPFITKKGAAIKLNYPTDTIGMWLEDVNVLKICDRKVETSNSADLWVLKEEYRELMTTFAGVASAQEGLVDSANGEDADGYKLTPAWMTTPQSVSIKHSEHGSDDKEVLKDEAERNQRIFDEL